MRRGECGAALLAALVVVAASAAVSAALATLARTEIVLARNRDAAARALAAADACLAAVIADLPAGWELAGIVTPPAACTATLHPAPGPAEPPRALLEVDAVAGAGRRVVIGAVARAAPPGVPALVWLTDAGTLHALAGTLALDGADATRPGAPAAAPLAAPDDPAVLDGWLATQGPHVQVTPPSAAPISVPPPPLAELATRMRAAGAAAGGTLVPAGTPPLALTLVPGDLDVAAAARGRGLLFVDGRLDIAGSFEFSGVVVASGGIRVAHGARLEVLGAVWLGAGAGLAVDGEARVAARGDELDAADGLLRLPRRARLAGLRDPP